MGWFRRDKTQDYARALVKVSVNLLEVATSESRADHAPIVLRADRPDTQLRYLAFCLATAFYHATTEDKLEVFNAAVKQAWEHFARWALTPDGKMLFNGPTNPRQAVGEASQLMADTMQRWRVYTNERVARHRQGIAIENDMDSVRLICEMVRAVESTLALTEHDYRRLTPLAVWIQQSTPSIKKAVAQLVG